MATPKKPGAGAYLGRPSKFKPEYCQMLVDHMSQGLALESFAAKINVTIKTLYLWRDAYPEFLQAFELGRAKSFAVWEKLGMQGMLKPGTLVSAIWAYNMRCRFNSTEFKPNDNVLQASGATAFEGYDI